MEIIETYFDEDEHILEVRYSTNPETDYFRSVKLTKNDIKYHSPIIIDDDEITELEDDSLIEILESYFYQNEMGEEELL